MASTPPPPHEQLHEQAFWIYTVIVGLALGQAVNDVLPRVLPAGFLDSAQQQPVGLDTYMRWLESLRLIVFLMMITRFFLGSVVFFKIANGKGGGLARPGASSREFFLGYLHFLLFFVWSLTLKSPTVRLGLSGYLITLGIILLLDQGYRLSSSWKAGGRIRVWASRNSRTAGLSFVALILANHYTANPLFVELPVLIIVSIATVRDFYETFSEKTPKLWFGIWP